MKTLWNEAEANAFAGDPLQLRAYTSRLLGQNPTLVLHGGGNTSVKVNETTFLGDQEALLYVKGSGWNLAKIKAEGFSAVRLRTLQRLAEMENLSDTVIVREQRAAMTDPYAPNPSVEAILHALIPYKFVDHTHADAVVTITNTPGGEEAIRQIYKHDRVLFVPYVMAGFSLARKVYEMTRTIDWAHYDAMILLHHGVFTFADDARTSYETMIGLVNKAEAYLETHGATHAVAMSDEPALPDLFALARLRQIVSGIAGRPMIARLDTSAESRGFASLPDAASLAARGLITPDHVSRIKHRAAVIEGEDVEGAIKRYAEAYRVYFARNAEGDLTMLDPAPRWVVWPGVGSVTFGATAEMAAVNHDIARHTMRAIQWAEALGGWQPLSEDHYFDMEYWELQQAKHKQAKDLPPLTGKIALVDMEDGAVAEALCIAGAIVVDSTSEDAVLRFGGLDLVVSGRSAVIEQAAPYLRLGVNPAAILLQDEMTAPEVRLNVICASDAMIDTAAVVSVLAGDAFVGAQYVRIE